MELQRSGGTIIFDNDMNSFEIFQMADNDIMFMGDTKNITCLLNYESRNSDEYKAAEIFGTLIRNIVGQYILEDKDINHNLPKDFINFDDKIITWHSDSGTDNLLEICFLGRSVIVSITQGQGASNNSIRIRSSGSSYGTYYQHFQTLHKNLLLLALQKNPPQKVVEEEEVKRKSFNLFGHTIEIKKR